MSDITLRRSRRRPRAVLMVPAASALILVLGWSVLWGVARQQAISAMDGWMAAEAAHGRQWSCPGRDVSGFPFRIALSCRDVAFNGVVDGAPTEGHLAGLSAEVWIHEPSSVDIALAGPLALASQDGHADFTLSWAGLHATLRGLVGGMKRVEFLAEGVDLRRPDDRGGHADRVALHAGPAAGRPGDDVAEAVDVAVAGAAIPVLDALTGEDARFDGAVTGVVTRALGDLPDFGASTVERWRSGGGHVEVSSLVLGKGDLKATAAGTLGLDDQHRLAGRLDAGLSGFEPLMRRFGVPVRAAAIGGLLAQLLGGKTAPPAPDASRTMTLPIVFGDGAMSIGPFKTALRLPSLY
jgi:hypothetical protein